MQISAPLTGIILGNGFDIAYNYKTSYSHFVDSEQFIELLKKGNSLAKYIKEVKNLQNWVDVEIEIGNFSYNMQQSLTQLEFINQTKIFKAEFFALRDALSLYISNQTSSLSNKKMDKLVEKWFDPAFLDRDRKIFITSFNYHQSDVVNIYNRFYDHMYERNLLQIHGQADFYSETPCNIVLGVDENNRRSPEHNFIVKAYDKNTKATPYLRTILLCDNYIIFGCSMGETDLRYFKPLLSQKGKKFDIYGFGDDGLIEIKSRISSICNLDSFITYNEVNFLNSEEYSITR